MFKKVISTIAKLAEQPQVDPSVFNDPVAMQTDWTPLKSGSTNFRTHILKERYPGRLEFLPTTMIKLFCGIFFVMGVVILVALSKKNGEMSWLGPFIGIIFAAAGAGMYYFASAPIVFDKEREYFNRGRKKPEAVFDPAQLKNHLPLKEIHALQLLSKRVSDDDGSYLSYELNLISHQGKRVHVLSHGHFKGIHDDANKLAGYLGKPLWIMP